MELAYPTQSRGERVYARELVCDYKFMNVADRRHSGAFAPLPLPLRTFVPSLNAAREQWVYGALRDDAATIDHIRSRMETLNQEIAQDRAFGCGSFRLGIPRRDAARGCGRCTGMVCRGSAV